MTQPQLPFALWLPAAGPPLTGSMRPANFRSSLDWQTAAPHNPALQSSLFRGASVRGHGPQKVQWSFQPRSFVATAQSRGQRNPRSQSAGRGGAQSAPSQAPAPPQPSQQQRLVRKPRVTGRSMRPKGMHWRLCVSCREYTPQAELFRVVRHVVPGSGSTYTVGLRKGMFGRSAYLCPEERCIADAEKKGKLARSLSGRPPEDIYVEIRRQLPERAAAAAQLRAVREAAAAAEAAAASGAGLPETEAPPAGQESGASSSCAVVSAGIASLDAGQDSPSASGSTPESPPHQSHPHSLDLDSGTLSRSA